MTWQVSVLLDLSSCANSVSLGVRGSSSTEPLLQTFVQQTVCSTQSAVRALLSHTNHTGRLSPPVLSAVWLLQKIVKFSQI